MSKKRKPIPGDLFNAALAQPPKLSKHAVAKYRDAILLLQAKGFSQVEITQFLRSNGLTVHRAAIGRYLQQHPPTDDESARIAELLKEQHLPAPVGAAPRPAESKQRKVSTPSASARTDSDDGIDYSFLRVQGRPFRIKGE